MVSVGSNLYVFGGLTDTEYSYSNELFRFSTTEQKWEQLNATRVSGSPPSPRSGHGMVSVGSDIHVFGGGMGSGYGSNDLFRFSTTEEKWEQLDAQRVSGSPPSARLFLCMVSVGSDLYVFGGGDPTGWFVGYSTELFRFVTTEQKWEQLDAQRVSGSPPSRQLVYGMVSVGSDLYVLGGDSNNGYSNDLFRFSSTEHKWENLDVGSPPSAKSGHRMVSVGSDLYVFGGDIVNLLVYTTRQVIAWPASGFSRTWFTRVYDGDIIRVTGDANWPSGRTVDVCLPPVPCFFTIAGNASASSTIRRHTNSGIVCEASLGCTGVTVRNVAVVCTDKTSAEGPLQILGAGAVATIEGATFSNCVSVEDGGSIRVYNGATANVSGTTFQRSSSQVLFLSCHSCNPLTPLPSV
jgi:N-acetylneuraminic acid mutarotase